MNKIIKAIYILIVAIIVFTGALMIAQGAKEHQGADAAVTAVIRTEAEPSPAENLFENEEGSAI